MPKQSIKYRFLKFIYDLLDHQITKEMLQLLKTDSLGRKGEKAALRHLKKNRCYILETNWRVRSGEIDIIARDKRQLVFIEVKTRNYQISQVYNPFEAVDNKKRNKLEMLANNYMYKNKVKLRRQRITSHRFDIIGILYYPKFWFNRNRFKITHIKDIM